MRYLIITDVHSNLDALDAVFQAESENYEQVLCCGDVVGYGPSPNEVIERLIACEATVIRGNHDKVACGIDDTAWFNESAERAILWTRRELTPDYQKFLLDLPEGPWISSHHGFQLVHGSLLDEDQYLYDEGDAYDALKATTVPITFFGHTHLPCFFALNSRGDLISEFIDETTPQSRATIRLDESTHYLINPGSVGQPRDRDPRAGYALFDPDKRTVELKRVEYDIEAVQEKMEKKGLPEYLIQRLAVGR
ncbi:MAG: metallophosphatase family protein [Acidobacteriia bacterium]|nr:metallophosphatase family protein [Terriglobia bacterium]